ncbi:hypothetical protein BC827DRAFT_1199500 [Russula dissimulans]|nr:hypothetical protein BC827DRAFT_1199500 [Russula dissimulans]
MDDTPWRPRLSLSVTEITSVSATFLISSLSSHHDSFDPNDTIPPVPADTLSKGLSVKVNGTPWRKCLARLADEADEVMIIIYGLMPGRHYDIELGIIPGDEKLKGQIVTESDSPSTIGVHTHSSTAGDRALSDSDSGPDIPPVGAFPTTTPNSPAVDPSPSPPSPSPPPTPSGGPFLSSQTFEEYLASLRLSLSNLQAEHEMLSNTLKAARRDSQRAQAAQRAEISSLKRAAQKHSAGDTRMKQKVRALEEAVKQAIKCREDVEAEYAVLEATRVEQGEDLADASRRFEEARLRAEEWGARRKKAEEEAGSRLHGARAELAAVEARLEKLRAKRERLEGRVGAEEGEEEEVEGEEETGEGPSRRGEDEDGLDVPGGLIGELEAKLREMLLEHERIEADPYGQAIPSHPDESAIAATATATATATAAAAAAAAVVSTDKLGLAGDGRTPGYAPPNHGRNTSHSHSHPAVRGKRPVPPFLHHHHSHSHPHSARPAATSSFSPPASAPAAARTSMTSSSTSPRSHPSTRISGPGKGAVARRKSSPPPHSHAEKSALSLNAPPFEPASIKAKMSSRAGGLTGS